MPVGMNLGEIFFRISARKKGLVDAERATRSFERTARKTGRTTRNLGIAISSVITSGALRKIIMVTDKYNVLQRRIQTATLATNDYNKVSNELFRVSQKTGSLLASNVAIFQRMAQVAPELNATTDEILKFTTALNQLGTIGGSSPTALKRGLLQLSQGISSSVLRAQEFNSIVENTPEIMVRIAKGMGTTIGQLRLAVVEGKVLSKDVYQSIADQADEINEQFQTMFRSVDQASIALQNNFSRFFGELDKTFNFTQGVVQGIDAATRAIDRLLPMILSIKSEVDTVTHRMSFWATAIRTSIAESEQFNFGMYLLGQSIRTVADAMGKLPEHLFFLYEISRAAATYYVTVFMGAVNSITFQFTSMWGKLKAVANITALKAQEVWLDVFGEIFAKFGDLVSWLGGISAHVPFLEDQSKTLTEIGNKINGIVAGDEERSEQLAYHVTQLEKFRALLNEAPMDLVSKEASDQLKHDIDAALNTLHLFQSSFAGGPNEIAKKAFTPTAPIIAPIDETGAGSDKRPNLDALIKELYDEREAIEAHYQEQLEITKAAEEMNIETIMSYSEIRQRIEDQRVEKLAELREKENQVAIDGLAQLNETLATELESLSNNYEAELNIIAEAEQLKLDTIIPYRELRERLEADHQEKLSMIQRDALKNMNIVEKAERVANLDFIKDVNSMTEEEHAAQFKRTMSEGATQSKALFEANKAMSVAQALIDAPSSILSAYKHGVSIAGPPLGAAYAAMAGVAVAAQIASIQSAQFRGGRAMGGNVSSDSMYEVNERGPEMLSIGNRDFLMMGSQSGKVTPSSSTRQKQVIVNVYPQPGEDAKISTRESEDITSIDVMIEQVENSVAQGIYQGDSPVSNAIESQYGINRAIGVA